MPHDTILKTVPLEIMYATAFPSRRGQLRSRGILCRSMPSCTNSSLATGRTARDHCKVQYDRNVGM